MLNQQQPAIPQESVPPQTYPAETVSQPGVGQPGGEILLHLLHINIVGNKANIIEIVVTVDIP
jgi:hypothetical protein